MIINFARNERATTANLTVSIIDKICYFGAVFMPATAVPQIYKLYTTQDATSLSLAMWIMFLFGVIPFLLFGIVHSQKQIIALNALWIVVIVTMIGGIVIYS